jgi:hypothetical protein
MTQTAAQAPIFPGKFAPPFNNAGSDSNLTALLAVDDVGKLAMLGGFNVTSVQEVLPFPAAPTVRAWRLTTGLSPVPQVATTGIQRAPGSPFCVPVITAGPSGPGGPIVVDVWLDSPTGPVDPAAVFGTPGGFVYLHVAPAGSKTVDPAAPP